MISVIEYYKKKACNDLQPLPCSLSDIGIGYLSDSRFRESLWGYINESRLTGSQIGPFDLQLRSVKWYN